MIRARRRCAWAEQAHKQAEEWKTTTCTSEQGSEGKIIETNRRRAGAPEKASLLGNEMLMCAHSFSRPDQPCSSAQHFSHLRGELIIGSCQQIFAVQFG